MKILLGVATFMLCVAVLLFSVRLVAFNSAFFDAQFEMNQTAAETGLTPEDLNHVRDGLISYLSGKSNGLQIYVSFGGAAPEPFYTEAELSHMVDARNAFNAANIAAWVLFSASILTAIISIVIASRRRSNLHIKLFTLPIILSCLSFLFIFAIIGAIIVANFDAAFTAFHHLFFPQGNWAFNNSHMIDILPGSLFADGVTIFVLKTLAFVFALISTAAAAYLLSCSKLAVKRSRTLHTTVAGSNPEVASLPSTEPNNPAQPT